MIVLGIESSCDETGLALFDTNKGGLLAHRLHSQVAMHRDYGGVVPELASRDHIQRMMPLLREVLCESSLTINDLGGIAYTEGPGLAGALLVGAGFARSLAYALDIPAVGVHHLEGHLLSPLLAEPKPEFPFVALLVSGGHTQLMQVEGVGAYQTLGDTLDDAAGEAFDKTAQLLELGYPGGPAVSKLAESGNPSRFKLPRPMLNSGDLNFSFSGLKTAVLTLRSKHPDEAAKADIAAAFQAAMVDVLAEKSMQALEQTGSLQLVVAGGVGANRQLRQRLIAEAAARGARVFFPPLDLCTDNGAMIAFAGAMRIQQGQTGPAAFSVKPRWDLQELPRA
ncbi:MAG: tRNA (adenosine(37)-N6)-threonylcarbamoyltransferase complex transferase subunit TsaD [Hydrogenophilaceae bacterium]|nr:tRNA (adenosine(37)-N6)-threonylcarbamoyltransferase complex transferase subunit TsaD [Hydrogenophilaceae bacterium]